MCVIGAGVSWGSLQSLKEPLDLYSLAPPHFIHERRSGRECRCLIMSIHTHSLLRLCLWVFRFKTSREVSILHPTTHHLFTKRISANGRADRLPSTVSPSPPTNQHQFNTRPSLQCNTMSDWSVLPALFLSSSVLSHFGSVWCHGFQRTHLRPVRGYIPRRLPGDLSSA